MGVSRDIITELIPQLGIASDSDLAFKYHLSRERIRQIRKEYRIEANPYAHLQLSRTVGDMILKDLPSLDNDSVMQKYKLPLTTINTFREKFNIPVKVSKETAERDKKLRDMIPALGTASDYAVAIKFGVHHAVVRYHRICKGIPPYKAQWQKKLSDEQELVLKKDLKTLTAGEISAKFDICKAVVYKYRNRFSEESPSK